MGALRGEGEAARWAAAGDSPNQRQRFSKAGRKEQDRLEMYGGIGDTARGRRERAEGVGVNYRGLNVRREIVWLRRHGEFEVSLMRAIIYLPDKT